MAWPAERGLDPARLEGVIRESGLSYRPGPKSWIFTCPLCRKRDKLYLRRSDGRFTCWVCGPERGFKGAPEFALAEMTGRRLDDLRRALYGSAPPASAGLLDVQFDGFGAEDEGEEVPPQLPDLAWEYHCYPLSHRWAAPGVAYLEARGVPRELAEAYDLRYSPRERAVAFPVWVAGRLVGWQYRTIDPTRVELPGGGFANRMRIWSNTQIPRDRVVMFADRLDKSDLCVLCEGPVDALKAHLVGGNVASMGTELTAGQVHALLLAGVRRLYVAFDPDAAATFDNLARRFGFAGAETYLVQVPKPYKDLGQMPLEAARDCILGAPRLLPGQMHAEFPGFRL